MGPLSYEHISYDPNLVVKDHCALIFGPNVNVILDDQLQPSLALMGLVGERDVVEECDGDVEVFYISLYPHALICRILTWTVIVLPISFLSICLNKI